MKFNNINLILLLLFLSGCAGSPAHMSMRYSSIQSQIKDNNNKLLNLKIGMSKDEVINLLGSPERSEGYVWGAVFLYRTAMTSGVYGTTDSDFTPVVFDEKDQLVGWGRNFFTEHIKRYDINIKNQ